MAKKRTRSDWIALITVVFSILISLAYLLLISILDLRGPMMPPPQEALGEVAIFSFDHVQSDLQLF